MDFVAVGSLVLAGVAVAVFVADGLLVLAAVAEIAGLTDAVGVKPGGRGELPVLWGREERANVVQLALSTRMTSTMMIRIRRFCRLFSGRGDCTLSIIGSLGATQQV